MPAKISTNGLVTVGSEILFKFQQDDEYLRIDRETDLAHRNLIDKLGSLTAENEELKVGLRVDRMEWLG